MSEKARGGVMRRYDADSGEATPMAMDDGVRIRCEWLVARRWISCGKMQPSHQGEPGFRDVTLVHVASQKVYLPPMYMTENFKHRQYVQF